jgi:hypothetical protein
VPEPVLFLVLSIVLLVLPIVAISYAVIRLGRKVDARDRARLEARKATRDREAESGVYLDERKLLKRCSNCDVFALTLPYQDEQGRTFCSTLCRDYVAARRPGFCGQCLAGTSDEAASLYMNELGIGWSFGGATDECLQCRSGVRTHWVKLFLVPLIPLGRYRAIQTSPYHYLSRRLL